MPKMGTDDTGGLEEEMSQCENYPVFFLSNHIYQLHWKVIKEWHHQLQTVLQLMHKVFGKRGQVQHVIFALKQFFEKHVE